VIKQLSFIALASFGLTLGTTPLYATALTPINTIDMTISNQTGASIPYFRFSTWKNISNPLFKEVSLPSGNSHFVFHIDRPTFGVASYAQIIAQKTGAHNYLSTVKISFYVNESVKQPYDNIIRSYGHFDATIAEQKQDGHGTEYLSIKISR
jgi:hypothetical protein